MNIIVFGPQGSGKGTQAELIARTYRLPYISTGDIFRYHLKTQTAIGAEISRFVNAGQLVSDIVTNQIVTERIQQPDCTRGLVFDGYPRTRVQYDFLQQSLTVDHALVITLSDEAAVERLAGRLACSCGLSYHLRFNPPRQPGICDNCGKALFRRDDDQPDAIRERLAIYHAETEPLFALYEAQGVLHRVDGSDSIEAVFSAIQTIIGPAEPQPLNQK